MKLLTKTSIFNSFILKIYLKQQITEILIKFHNKLLKYLKNYQ